MRALARSSFSFWLSKGKETFTRLLRSEIGQEILGSFGLKIANVGLVFLGSVLVARGLGPAQYGIYAYVYALITLVAIPAEFGLPTLLVRETARGLIQGDYALVRGIWRWSSQIVGVLSLFLTIVTIIFLVVFPNAFTGERLKTLLWGLALIPLIALGDLRGAALRGLQKVVAGQLPEFLLRPGLFALLLGGVMLWRVQMLSASLAMALYVIAALLAFLSGVWLLWQVTPLDVAQSLPRYEGRIWLASAWSLAWIGGMQVINQQVAILLQGFFVSDEQIGLFRVATQVSQVATIGLMAVNMAIAPRLAALYASREIPKLQRLVTKSTRVILLFNLIITVGFIFAGRTFLSFFFGHSYQRSYWIIVILLIGQFINSATGSVANLLNMTSNETETAKARTLSTVINISLNLLLLPPLGVVGSAIATSISLIVWNIILWWQAKEKLGINSMAFY